MAAAVLQNLPLVSPQGDAAYRLIAERINQLIGQVGGAASSVPWSGVTGTPTTLGGYGITDALKAGSVGTSIGAIKASDTARNTTITLTDDPELQGVALPVGKYAYEAFIKPHNVTTAANGFQGKLNFTGTCTGQFAASGIVNNVAQDLGIVFSNYNSSINLSNVTAATNFDYLHVKGFVFVTVAGNMSLQWAQHSSGANSTILDQGSFIRFTRIS